MFSDSILFTNDMEEAVDNADLIILVVPANFIDDTTRLLKGYYNNQHICIASKGIEESRGEFYKTPENYSCKDVCG